MLQKARFTAFTFFELLRENQEWSIFEKLDFRLIFKSRSKKEITIKMKMKINYAIVMNKSLLNRCFLMTRSLSKGFST